MKNKMEIKVNLAIHKTTGEVDRMSFKCWNGDSISISDPEDPEVIKIELTKLSGLHKWLYKFLKMTIDVKLNTKVA